MLQIKTLYESVSKFIEFLTKTGYFMDKNKCIL